MRRAARLACRMNLDKTYQDYYQRLLESTALSPPPSLARIMEDNRVPAEVNQRGNKVSLRTPEKLACKPRS
jgi:hypothetical protein